MERMNRKSRRRQEELTNIHEGNRSIELAKERRTERKKDKKDGESRQGEEEGEEEERTDNLAGKKRHSRNHDTTNHYKI